MPPIERGAVRSPPRVTQPARATTTQSRGRRPSGRCLQVVLDITLARTGGTAHWGDCDELVTAWRLPASGSDVRGRGSILVM